MPKPAWHILTGEYPPTLGGVSDYTRSVARALADSGDEVHVWAPAPNAALAEDRGVIAHPLPDRFGPRSLARLSAELAADPRPKRLLVQYVPHAFGMRAMNLPFCAWIAAHRRDEIWVMFHEVVFPWSRRQPWRHNVLAGVTRVMASMLANRADRLFVSAPAWNDFLARLIPRPARATWLPIPSNIPSRVLPADVARVRAAIPRVENAAIVGHFGTYGTILTPLLADVFKALLAGPRPRALLLLGRGGPSFAREQLPSARVSAPGSLSGDDIALYLAACDIVVQPYVDGVSTRRTTVMASLALGVPVVTNEGALSEDLWRRSGAVALAPSPAPEAIAFAAEGLLADAEAARRVGARGRAVYERDFSLPRTIEVLRGTR